MKKVTVALNANSAAFREFIMGIFRYVNLGHPLSLQFIDGPEAVTPEFVSSAKQNGIEGVITGSSQSTPGYKALVVSGIPTALIGYPMDVPLPKNGSIATVLNDDFAIGRMGAAYLRGRGQARSFAFLPASDGKIWWSARRQRGFRLGLAESGIEPIVFRGPRERLGAWLKDLPKPTALMTSNDIDAHLAIETCKTENILVPEQITILGVDNDELICGNIDPTLSSIDPDHAMLGFKACEALWRILAGRRRKSTGTMLVPPLRVVERDSTLTVPPAGHLIRQALLFIRENYANGISVADVARHLGISTSLLRLRFQTIHGKSVRDVILDTRLAAAQRMLSSTDETIAYVANACGFSSTCRLSHFFHERLGRSPTEWRNRRPANADKSSPAIVQV